MRRTLAVLVLIPVALAAVFLGTWCADRSSQDVVRESGPESERVPHADPASTRPGDADLASEDRTRSQRAAASPMPDSASAGTSWTGLRVRAVSEDSGAALAGVPIHVSSPAVRTTARDVPGSRGTIAEIPKTDTSGHAEIVLDPGFLGTVHARGIPGSAGSASAEITTPLAEGEVRAIELALPTALDLVLHGRVVDRETNAPIPGAAVGPTEHVGKLRAGAERRTDGDGRFRFEGASWERVVVQVIAPGYEPAAARLATGYADPARPLEFALSRVASARITVTDAGGAPLADTELRLATDAYRFGRPDGTNLIQAGWTHDVIHRATTDAAGRALFQDLPPRMPLEGSIVDGREVVYRAPEEFALEPGELREVAWRLGAGCAIHGLALEESGAPAANLEIALQPARFPTATLFEPHAVDDRRLARTDADGRFVFTDVAPGAWWLGPFAKPRGRNAGPAPEDVATAAQLVDIAPGTTRADVTVRVMRGHVIQGRLLDPDGRPAPHGFVEIVRADGSFRASRNINARDGAFTLGPLDPGEYVLTASAISKYLDAPAVTARTGDTDVVIQFRRGISITGVVAGSDGKPVPRANVLVNARVPGRFANRSTATDDDGRFHFEGLVPGLHDIAACTEHGEVGLATDVDATAGAAPVDVRIETAPGARVRVRYAGPWPHVGLTVLHRGVTIEADGIEKGTEKAFRAVAGAVVVRVTRYPERTEFDLPLTLVAGETRDLVFDGGWK